MEQQGSSFVKNSIEAAIRLMLFFGMIVFCYIIMMPFLSIILGGIILAVAAAPILTILKSKFKISDKWGAILITTIALVVFILPSYILIHSLVKEFNVFILETNSAQVALYIEKLKHLPLIEDALYDFLKKK